MRLPPRRWNRLGPARHRRHSDLRCVMQRETRSDLHWERQREGPRNCQSSVCFQFTFQRSDTGYTLANRPTPVETKEKLLLTDGRERWLAVGVALLFSLFPCRPVSLDLFLSSPTAHGAPQKIDEVVLTGLWVLFSLLLALCASCLDQNILASRGGKRAQKTPNIPKSWGAEQKNP